MADRKRFRLKNLSIDRVDLVDRGANGPADVVLYKRHPEPFAKATKTENGQSFSAGAYAYVPDPSKPSTWKLRLEETPGKVTARQVGMAIAALGPGGFRGQKVQIPSSAMGGVKAKVRTAWRKANPSKKPADMPSVLKRAEGLGAFFDKMAGAGTGQAVTTKEIYQQDQLEDGYEEITEAFRRSMNRIMYWPDIQGDPIALLKQSVQEYGELLTQLTNNSKGVAKSDSSELAEAMEGVEVMMEALDGAGDLDTFKQLVAGFGDDPAPGDNPGLDGSESQSTQKGDTMERTVQDVLKDIRAGKTLTPEDAALVEAAAKGAEEPGSGDTDPGRIDKSALDPKALEVVEKMEARLEDEIAKRKDFEARFNKAEDERLAKEAVERARAFEPVRKAEEFGPVLRKAESGDADAIAEVLKVAHEAIERGKAQDDLLKQFGAGNQFEAEESGDNFELIEAKAKELQKAHPELSREQAIAKAIDEDPELANAYARSQAS